MKILLIFLMLLLLFFTMHIALWRLVPRLQSKKTLLGCCILMFLGIALFRVTFFEFTYIALAYWSACISYLIFYTWIETDSPSIKIVDYLSQRSDHSSTLETLKIAFAEQNPIHHRLDCLVKDGFCRLDNEGYVLTGKGKWIAKIFGYLGSLLSISLGG